MYVVLVISQTMYVCGYECSVCIQDDDMIIMLHFDIVHCLLAPVVVMMPLIFEPMFILRHSYQTAQSLTV